MSKFLMEFRTAKHLLKTEGIKALFRRYGWKLIFCLFVYYIVRDVVLYVLVPLGAMRLFSQ